MSFLTATTEGSLRMMPRPRTLTSVFAVPRSIPMSTEKRPSAHSKGLNTPLILSRELPSPRTTTPPGRPPRGLAAWRSLVDADPSTEEKVNFISLADGKEVRIFQEERSLFREPQVEPCQVDLLGIHFDLREIGVDRDVQIQASGDAEFGVEADIAIEVRFRGRGEVTICRADHVGHDLEISRPFQFQAAQLTGR